MDIEIRVGDGRWPGFTSERIENSTVIAVGRLGKKKPEALADLAGDTLIEIMEVDDAWGAALPRRRSDPAARCQVCPRRHSLYALELAAAGIGDALILRSFAEPYLRSQRLVQLLSIERAARLSHYLLQPLDVQRRKPQALLFAKWLMQQARADGLMTDAKRA